MNIIVSNLSSCTTEEHLKALFSEFGFVNSVKIMGGSEVAGKNIFAFVNMPSALETAGAVFGMNDKDIEGNILSVTVDNENRADLNLFQHSNEFFL